MKKEAFKKYFDLNTKVCIYVPSTIEVNKPIDNSEFCSYVQRKLSEMFGGATTNEAYGSYVCNNGELLNEKVSIVYSFCSTDQIIENIEKVVEICEYLKKEMSQESILLEVNNKVKFI